jgi:type II/IV secretion system protein
MLRTALGPAIARFLEDPAVVEVMLNPDGRLWIDRLSEGLADTGERLSPADGERIVRLVAHHVGAEVHPGAPRVSAELPDTGDRFEGLLPPVVAAPAFAIRKPAVAVFTLDDYVAAGIMLAGQAEALRIAVAERRNILVAGGTSTGKTTLTNALLFAPLYSTPALALSSTAVSFSATAGGASPAAKTVQITNAGPGSLSSLSVWDVGYEYVSGQKTGWLSASPLSGVPHNCRGRRGFGVRYPYGSPEEQRPHSSGPAKPV